MPKANVDHTISGQGTADSTLDHSATTPGARYLLRMLHQPKKYLEINGRSRKKYYLRIAKLQQFFKSTLENDHLITLEIPHLRCVGTLDICICIITISIMRNSCNLLVSKIFILCANIRMSNLDIFDFLLFSNIWDILRYWS